MNRTPPGSPAPLGSALVRGVGTAAGVLAFCVFSRSWEDGWRLLYDVSAAVAVYSFLSQVLAEGVARQTDCWWRARLAAAAAMTLCTVGRQWWGWNVSGHVSTVLATALLQGADSRLSWRVRSLYWVPLPLVLAIRIGVLDRGLAAPLGWGLLAGTAIGGGALLCGRRG